MSNRFITFVCALIGAVATFLVTGILLIVLNSHPPVPLSSDYSSFQGTINDRPVIGSLPRYFELVSKGRTTVSMGGVAYTIFWQDFNTEERRILGDMLRVP